MDDVPQQSDRTSSTSGIHHKTDDGECLFGYTAHTVAAANGIKPSAER